MRAEVKEVVKPRKDWFIKEVTNRIKSHRNFVMIIHGPTRSGKSALGVKICEQLDPDFSEERVFFFLDELFPLVRYNKLPPGSFALIDEAGASLDARRFMSAINVHSTHVFEAFGIKEVSVVFTLPSLKMIDANVRRLMHCMAFQRDRGYARIYRIGTQYDGAIYSFRIGKFYGVKMPSKDLWNAYLKKKWTFLDAVLDQAITGVPGLERDWTPEEIDKFEDTFQEMKDEGLIETGGEPEDPIVKMFQKIRKKTT